MESFEALRNRVLNQVDLREEIEDDELIDVIHGVFSYDRDFKRLSLKERSKYGRQLFNSFRRLDVLQDLLGHESLLTTQKYLKITPGHLRESYMAAHPRTGEEDKQ